MISSYLERSISTCSRYIDFRSLRISELLCTQYNEMQANLGFAKDFSANVPKFSQIFLPPKFSTIWYLPPADMKSSDELHVIFWTLHTCYSPCFIVTMGPTTTTGTICRGLHHYRHRRRRRHHHHQHALSTSNLCCIKWRKTTKTT